MTAATNAISEAVFIDAPRDEAVRALFEYWRTICLGRVMPSRVDIDPTKIAKLLPYIIMYNVLGGDQGYNIRLVGEEVKQFVGRNTTGLPAGSIMTPRAAEMIIQILDAVVTERAPKFRAGKAHWLQDKSLRNFEACFLPLSSDGVAVDIILGGVRFPL